MFIQTEETPNPATLKFIPGQTVMEQGTANFETRDSAANSPLALRLFDVSGVTGVFLAGDFITVTKDGVEWQHIKPALLGAIMDHYTSGEPVMTGAVATTDGGTYDEADEEVVGQIKELLETRVRPAVAADGGDIVFHGFERGVVYLHMQGSCAGCPSSTLTLKSGIERLLRHYVPEVTEVRALEA